MNGMYSRFIDEASKSAYLESSKQLLKEITENSQSENIFEGIKKLSLKNILDTFSIVPLFRNIAISICLLIVFEFVRLAFKSKKSYDMVRYILLLCVSVGVAETVHNMVSKICVYIREISDFNFDCMRGFSNGKQEG